MDNITHKETLLSLLGTSESTHCSLSPLFPINITRPIRDAPAFTEPYCSPKGTATVPYLLCTMIRYDPASHTKNTIRPDKVVRTSARNNAQPRISSASPGSVRRRQLFPVFAGAFGCRRRSSSSSSSNAGPDFVEVEGNRNVTTAQVKVPVVGTVTRGWHGWLQGPICY